MSFPIFQEQDYGGMLGRAIGDSLGGGFHTGILNQYQQQQQQQQQQKEMSSLQQAISQAGNDPQSQLKALLTAPVSNETKKLAIQSFQNQQQMAQQGLQQQESKNKQERLFEQQEKLQKERLEQQEKLANLKYGQKQHQELEKQQQEKEEAEILSKYARGEKLTPEEQSKLSPKSQRVIIGAEKPIYEPTEERLEAERVSKLAESIVNDYESAKNEDFRLDRMEKLNKEKGEKKVITPLMAKTMEFFGLPLGILSNPQSEEYAKLEADFVRDVSKVFPGQIRVYEIQAYLRTVPTLMNSPEGREAVIRNRKLMNEAKKVRYDEYKKILKENNGRKPRNLDQLIEERTGDKIRKIGQEFTEGMENSLDEKAPTVPMKDSQGNEYNIPYHMIPQATKQGFVF